MALSSVGVSSSTKCARSWSLDEGGGVYVVRQDAAAHPATSWHALAPVIEGSQRCVRGLPVASTSTRRSMPALRQATRWVEDLAGTRPWWRRACLRGTQVAAAGMRTGLTT